MPGRRFLRAAASADSVLGMPRERCLQQHGCADPRAQLLACEQRVADALQVPPREAVLRGRDADGQMPRGTHWGVVPHMHRGLRHDGRRVRRVPQQGGVGVHPACRRARVPHPVPGDCPQRHLQPRPRRGPCDCEADAQPRATDVANGQLRQRAPAAAVGYVQGGRDSVHAGLALCRRVVLCRPQPPARVRLLRGAAGADPSACHRVRGYPPPRRPSHRVRGGPEAPEAVGVPQHHRRSQLRASRERPHARGHRRRHRRRKAQRSVPEACREVSPRPHHRRHHCAAERVLHYAREPVRAGAAVRSHRGVVHRPEHRGNHHNHAPLPGGGLRRGVLRLRVLALRCRRNCLHCDLRPGHSRERHHCVQLPVQASGCGGSEQPLPVHGLGQPRALLVLGIRCDVAQDRARLHCRLFQLRRAADVHGHVVDHAEPGRPRRAAALHAVVPDRQRREPSRGAVAVDAGGAPEPLPSVRVQRRPRGRLARVVLPGADGDPVRDLRARAAALPAAPFPRGACAPPIGWD
eukprot:PhM_4_TR18074/c1_g1_i2/m.44506